MESEYTKVINNFRNQLHVIDMNHMMDKYEI